MIITLAGPNAYLRHRELGALVNMFVAEHGDIGLERLDGDEVALERISEAVGSPPFLANKKMVVLRQGSQNKQFVEQHEILLAALPDTTDLVIVEPKLDKRSSYYKYLKKMTDFREYPEPDAINLARWLVDTAQARGGSLSISDARFMIERVGVNQLLLDNELEKLLLYQPAISRQTIDLLTEATPQSTIFQLLEAAFAGNAQRLLGLYAEQRALKVEPPQIIAMLAWQLHILAIIKAAGNKSSEDIAKEARISPYVVQKSAAAARALSLATIKKLISDLANVDIRTKRENIDPDEALQHYLLLVRRIHV